MLKREIADAITETEWPKPEWIRFSDADAQRNYQVTTGMFLDVWELGKCRSCRRAPHFATETTRETSERERETR